MKDQYIFGLGIKEIQDNLLGEIVTEDSEMKCLLESCKVGSKIEQRKLLGIKTFMTYDAIYRGRNKSRGKSYGRNTNLEAKAMVEIGLVVLETETVSTVVKPMAMEIVWHLVKSVKDVERKTTSSLFAVMIHETIVILGKRKAKRARDFTKLMKRRATQWMI